MRKSWTDDRLDYLNHKVDDGFKRMDERFEQMNERMLELHRLMIQGGIAMFGTVCVGLATVLASTL